MHTVALIGKNGSVDWFCFPDFDSPSVFASILDDEKGGSFKIAPVKDNVTLKQFYWPDTNVLVTRFLAPEGVAEIIDFMPVSFTSTRQELHHKLVRKVKVVRGNMRFHLSCKPAFNYARDDHTLEFYNQRAIFRSNSLDMTLLTQVDMKQHEGAIVSDFTLGEGETADFIFMMNSPDLPEKPDSLLKETDQLQVDTINFWQQWISKSTYKGRWREMVNRSALVLKLLTYQPTGAIVAAPTTSLPESLGGERNWDYRYTWIRDSAFTLYALMRIGYTEEASHFMDWLEKRCEEMNDDGSLQIVYSIRGEHRLDEHLLSHLKGYRNSFPVRVGNAAYDQLQLDIYGELLDTIYLFNKYGRPISYDLWTYIVRMLNYVCDHWTEKDEGIWEVRGGKQRFTYSMLMCWVALDRGIRLAQKRSFPADLDRWLKTRNRIYQTILSKGWSDKRNAFIQYVGSQSLDASNLIMPLVFFMSPTDPRMLKTIQAIHKSPEQGGLVSDSLVYRYDVDETHDGMDGDEGTFNICSFWLIEALTRAGRYNKNMLNQARFMFNKALTYSNHLGLYSEELGHSGEALGNFPQAFTHLSLISTAYNLDKELG